MKNLRNISDLERRTLELRGCMAESWESVYVSDDFTTDQLFAVLFGGRVELGRGVRISRSYVANYSIGEGSTIDSVARLECRHASSFGNGTRVATINENGGRSILIYDELRAQMAYVWALYRHQESMCDRLSEMVSSYSEQRISAMGKIGRNCTITASNIIREVELRDDVTIEGASRLECSTLMTGCFVGADVKLREVIVAEDSRIDSGANLERCFVGESSIVASGFSAIDSLIFASSHLENGEAASIFAAPFTVSHHKSSLLIAGYFGFFNAGSGSNQSNHLFKMGAVHQAFHARGCKFASGAYVMAPAREGAFTMVKGSHSRHHDTEAFPYSYLIEDGGRSMLMPGANLTSYGTRRDIEKWPSRDKRKRRRDVINYQEYNPYITGAMVRAVNTIHALTEKSPSADEYMWERVVIRSSQLRRGLGLYNKAIAASLGEMLSRGSLIDANVDGEWADIAGAYLPMSVVMEIIEEIASGKIAKLSQVDDVFRSASRSYDDYAHTWANSLLSQLLGAAPSQAQIDSTISSSASCIEELKRLTDSDMKRDSALSMAIGYGVDFTSNESLRELDFRVVRGLK